MIVRLQLTTVDMPRLEISTFTGPGPIIVVAY